jgi:universal stress protein E
VRTSQVPTLVVRTTFRRPVQRMLLTTDLSELSTRVHCEALDLIGSAFRFEAPRLRSLLVIGDDRGLPWPLQGNVADVARRDLDDFLKPHARRGPPVSGWVRQGDPHAEILAAAAEWQPDLLVLGTHSRRGWSRMVLGSVAERVAREVECNVFVVPACCCAEGYQPAHGQTLGAEV